MRVAVESSKRWVTRARTTPERFTQPEIMLSPTVASRGTLSPVRATVSRLVEPSTISASTGTRSPGLTTIISPSSTSSGEMVTSCPSRSTVALSGRISMSLAIDFLLLSEARCSNTSPTWKNSMTKTASSNMGEPLGTKPMSKAPTVAMVMSRSSLKHSPSVMLSHASRTTSYPATA